MKQAQSVIARCSSFNRRRLHDLVASVGRCRALSIDARIIEYINSWLWAEIWLNLLVVLWFIFTMPFRLIFRTIAWVGRLTAVLLGFCIMVIGIAAASFRFFLGIPIFLIGLVLTLKCLD